MLLLVTRRIWNNKWLMLCLLSGFILVVAMVSCVPIYTNGILQYMLTRDMQDFQTEQGVYPGYYEWSMGFAHVTGSRFKEYDKYDELVEQTFLNGLGVDTVTALKAYDAGTVKYTAVNEQHRTSDVSYMSVTAVDSLKDHVKIVRGRMSEPGRNADGYYEAVISESAMQTLGLRLDTPYYFNGLTGDFSDERMFVVTGLIDQADYTDTYWYQGIAAYSKTIFLYPEDFEDVLMSDGMATALSSVRWFLAIDYTAIGIDDVGDLLKTLQDQQLRANEIRALSLNVPIMDTLAEYAPRSSQLQSTLWIILAPLLVMLCLYIVMVSQLIVRSDENEISVLRSRGASAFQIFRMYLYEGLILSAAALLIGPWLGLLLCRVVGASNGFLEFVHRAGLPLSMKFDAWLYSLAAVVLFLAAMLLPAYKAARTTIVERKRKKSRFADLPFWQKYFLDFILLGISLYGYFSYGNWGTLMSQGGYSSTDMRVDPLLFLLSSTFIISLGLIFLRIYPYLIRLIFAAGKKRWTPSVYASFVHVGRSARQEQFLMMFLVLSIGVGIFSANFARSLNRHGEDSINYALGADVVLTANWSNNAEQIAAEAEASGDRNTAKRQVTYIEPDFTPYRQMKTIDAAAKVFIQDKGVVTVGAATSKGMNNVRIMGIDPTDFGRTAWFRNDLLPYHWYEYLNIMVDASKAVLISPDIAETYGLEPGDNIYITWDNQTRAECTVYAVVGYWPGYDTSKHEGLVVANLSYLQSRFAKQPYQVWLSRAAGATDTMVNEELGTMDVSIKSVDYANQKIIVLKNDPLLQGINGMLTLSFIITMVITFIGFLIYWVLSIRGRVLQFGIFRAMGMTMRQVLGMIACEQVLISVTSIVVGILLGGIASDLFVPLVQTVYTASGRVLPFLVNGSRSDYWRIYAVLGVMLATGMGVLARTISRTRIDQALKLGED